MALSPNLCHPYCLRCRLIHQRAPPTPCPPALPVRRSSGDSGSANSRSSSYAPFPHPYQSACAPRQLVVQLPPARGPRNQSCTSTGLPPAAVMLLTRHRPAVRHYTLSRARFRVRQLAQGRPPVSSLGRVFIVRAAVALCSPVLVQHPRRPSAGASRAPQDRSLAPLTGAMLCRRACATLCAGMRPH